MKIFRMVVDPAVNGMCVDTNMQCPAWASTGEQTLNAMTYFSLAELLKLITKNSGHIWEKCAHSFFGTRREGEQHREMSANHNQA